MITSLSIHDFDYELPDSAVAKYPLPDRDQSKLLVWNNTIIEDHSFSDLPGLLPEGSMLVFNNTRVIRARLHFTKSTGAKIEVFCLEPTAPHDYVMSFAQTSACRWKCIVGNLKRWKGEKLRLEIGEMRDEIGDRIEEIHESRGGCDRPYSTQIKSVVVIPFDRQGTIQPDPIVTLFAELIGALEGGFEVEFSWDNPEYTFADILEAAGNIPIPPYLHRESEEIDTEVYQTVYSKIKGSVAAPTAGLHFTDRVFKALAERNISC